MVVPPSATIYKKALNSPDLNVSNVIDLQGAEVSAKIGQDGWVIVAGIGVVNLYDLMVQF